ncbi:spore cortex-lytic enzyme [Polycladomyces abyssicola]|uniref:Spore cortex-lytic enzyme n=2 Tax=Polycladomyces abyssicola TaxID=1125966 RepID=A0A8D5UF31_9BACL|nr:spore cortex-lytic enzyme [Polycladomyces abyssicola]
MMMRKRLLCCALMLAFSVLGEAIVSMVNSDASGSLLSAVPNGGHAVSVQSTAKASVESRHVSKRVSIAARPARVYKPGDRGGYVWELQRRLRFLGFYTGKINGIYTWRTYRAVRLFQYAFGLRVTGLTDARTRAKLWKATRRWRPGGVRRVQARRVYRRTARQLSWNDIKLMAHAVHAEARGEPYIGKVAVAAVILNRLKSERFPNTPASIIFQPLAFEAVANGQIWLQPDPDSFKAVRDALNGWDPSDGALYYFNPATATSKWIWSRPQIKRIGRHIFTK